MRRDEIRLNWQFLCRKIWEVESIHQCVGAWRGYTTCVLSEHRQLSLPLPYVLKQYLVAGELEIVISSARFVLRILLRHRATKRIFKGSVIVGCKCRLHFLYFIEHSFPHSRRSVFKLAFRSIRQVLKLCMILLDWFLIVFLTRGIIIISRRQYELCLVENLVFLWGVLVWDIIYFTGIII